MNFEQNGYSEEEVLKMLHSNNRKVYYEYTLTDTQGQMYSVSITDGTITFDSNTEVMRTFSGTMRKTDYFNINTVEARLKPWFCLKTPQGNVLKWSLGVFLISGNAKCEAGAETIEIVGYDLGKIAFDEGLTSRLYFASGTNYTSAISQLLGEVYTTYNVEDATQAMENPIEWELGEKRLKVINVLLKAINYNDLFFDENGVAQCTPFIYSADKQVDIQYLADKNSIIKDGITKESNKFEIPNKFVRYTEDADANYYISTYINDNEKDVYSTVNRGRVITDIDSVDDIATQANLDAYVRKIAQEKREAIDSVEFTSLNMPCHSYRNCIFLSCDLYGLAGKYIETGWEMELAVGGTMTHRLQKVSEL